MRRTLVGAAAVGAVAAAAIGGIAWATTPAQSGVIKACYQKNNGQLRIVDSLDACTTAELPLQWNQTGPQGTTGAQGATGARGAQGPTGERGPQGATGATGPQGISGTAGLNGAKGDRGPTGATGDRGPVGPPGPTGAAGAAPVTPPSPYQYRDSSTNQLLGTFGLQLQHETQAIRVTSFAGCNPTAFGALPGPCYLTVRGLPDTLEQWLQDTLARSPDAVQDLTLRGPQVLTTPDVQFVLHDAFITSATLDLDVSTPSAIGSVDLVVAANGFDKVTPTAGPTCDCNSGNFFGNNFSLAVGGTTLAGTVAIDGLGFTVPRLGTTSYSPGTPSVNTIRVAASSAAAGAAATTRSYLSAWSDNVAAGNTDARAGEITLRDAAFNSAAQVSLSHLEPVFPFEPMFVDGRQTLTLRAEHIQFH